MGVQLACDISNYQGDLPQQVFDTWRDAGCRTVICGTDGSGAAPLVFPQQATKAATAGMAVEAYVYLYFGSNGFPSDVVGRTNQKLDMIAQVPNIKRVWVDCEDTTSGLTPAQIVDLISAACDAVALRGYEVGIYTGGWWWGPYTADSVYFSGLPLWTADYDGNADLEFSHPFGGWTSLYRKQYTDKGSLGGVSPLDLNAEVSPELPPAQPDDFQRGRREMFDAWVREDERRHDEVVAASLAHLEWVKARESEWGIP